MERTAVNPSDWGQAFFMNQAEVVTGGTRRFKCSGQVAMQPDPESEIGLGAAHVGDMAGQIAAALGSVDELLAGAEMDRSNIVFINFFTTDIDGFLANYGAYAEWIAPSGVMPPQSLIGVSRLVLPDLLVEIEVEAVA